MTPNPRKITIQELLEVQAITQQQLEAEKMEAEETPARLEWEEDEEDLDPDKRRRYLQSLIDDVEQKITAIEVQLRSLSDIFFDLLGCISFVEPEQFYIFKGSSFPKRYTRAIQDLQHLVELYTMGLDTVYLLDINRERERFRKPEVQPAEEPKSPVPAPNLPAENWQAESWQASSWDVYIYQPTQLKQHASKNAEYQAKWRQRHREKHAADERKRYARKKAERLAQQSSD